MEYKPGADAPRAMTRPRGARGVCAVGVTAVAHSPQRIGERVGRPLTIHVLGDTIDRVRPELCVGVGGSLSPDAPNAAEVVLWAGYCSGSPANVDGVCSGRGRIHGLFPCNLRRIGHTP